jgi:2,3-bisphosphoglycerate-dependent phosphoglycerate mutase/probable phosphoglycerate mutase
VSSDLSRAVSTAEEIGQALGLPVKLDARLRETNLGGWQGLTIPDVEARWPADLERWRGDPTWAPPGGESRVQVAARAVPVVAELEAEFSDEELTTALLCAHGGLIAGLVCALIGLEEPSWTAIGGLGNARWAVVRRRQMPGSPWRLTGFDLGPLE